MKVIFHRAGEAIYEDMGSSAKSLPNELEVTATEDMLLSVVG